MARPLQVLVTVDVEEDGLFGGRYERHPPTASSTRGLARLAGLAQEFSIPLTLLTTYPVASDPACRNALLDLRDNRRAEIGAHLHPWNTPPFRDGLGEEPVASRDIPSDLLRAKLDSLADVIEGFAGRRPTSFRMGRFDFSPAVESLLPSAGFTVDSSVVPFRAAGGVGNRFLSPADPHLLQSGRLLEVPLTMACVVPRLALAVERFNRGRPEHRAQRLRRVFRRVTVAGVQPGWYPLASMKLAAALHRSRGGAVLNLFLHSTELVAGATPQFRDDTAVDGLLRKTRSFLEWLRAREAFEGVALSGLSAPPRT